jgi:hypothetical protein
MGFRAAPAQAVSDGATSAAVADYDGDGRLDVILNSGSATVSTLLRGNGDGTFVGSMLNFSEMVVSANTADFNNDGHADYVGLAPTASQVSVFLGNGDGTFRPKQSSMVASNATDLEIGDLDGDGIADVVTLSVSAGMFSASLGKGDGTFNTPTVMPAMTTSIDLADFNRDGNLDVLTANTASGTLFTIFPGKGDGTFDPKIDTMTAPMQEFFVIGDVNGDQRPDVLTEHMPTAAMNVATAWLGNGDGTFSQGATIMTGTAEIRRLDDFGDSAAVDLICLAPLSAEVRVGNGDGTFQPPISLPFASRPTNGRIADFDGNGRLDIMVLEAMTDQLGVLLNECEYRDRD